MARPDETKRPPDVLRVRRARRRSGRGLAVWPSGTRPLGSLVRPAPAAPLLGDDKGRRGVNEGQPTGGAWL